VYPPILDTENTVNWTAFREVTAETAAEAALGMRRSVGQSGDVPSTVASDC